MLAATLVCILAQTGAAQADPRWTVAVISELSRESWTFHFENPSRYDTAELVPHFFEQKYDAGNIWMGARIGHPLWANRGEITLAFTPQRTRRADDFDTFFQPDGNVVVTGTTGGAAVRSWRIGERFTVARRRGLTLAFGYAYRRHRARYHDGDGITETTRPPSITHRLVTTRETTVSELHEPIWSLQVARRAGGGRIDAAFDVTPLALGRLTVDLPDKYPGRLLVFNARVSTFGGRVGYAREQRGWTWRVGARAGRSVSWKAAEQLDARAISVEFGLMPR